MSLLERDRDLPSPRAGRAAAPWGLTLGVEPPVSEQKAVPLANNPGTRSLVACSLPVCFRFRVRAWEQGGKTDEKVGF